ncbi:MAG: Cell division topological determinant MinJ [Firmicutes bacterium]|nr:Cell division topological determinant MinJ [Bacillota bacterium]MDI6704875.1 PDZ domain-containing protein [Bacillota bacterium]
MFPIVDLTIMVIKSIISVFINPLFWVVLFLVYSQYKRSSRLEEKMLGKSKYSVKDRVVSSALTGLLGGIIGSAVMVVVGVTLDNTGIIYVWIIAILLMMINPRYMCFSYAGGIVSLASLIFGYPSIDVSALMSIVAILHLVESVLIYFNGSKHSIPVFMEDKRYGVVGGYNLVRFWPIPIIIMTAVTGQIIPGETIPMPDWWPMLKAMGLEGKPDDVIYLMLPVVAALGYSDIAITETPERKSRDSAVKLLGYSITLLIISVLSSYQKPLQWVAAVVGPLMHELLIIASRKTQKQGKPLYLAADNGIRVLDVLPGSPAEKMGIKRGDILHRINGKEIANEADIGDILNYYPTYMWVDAVTVKGERTTYEFTQYPVGVGKLGVLVVPRDGDVPVAAMEVLSPLKRWIRRFRNTQDDE